MAAELMRLKMVERKRAILPRDIREKEKYSAVEKYRIRASEFSITVVTAPKTLPGTRRICTGANPKQRIPTSSPAQAKKRV
jgi:hypothetical protein